MRKSKRQEETDLQHVITGNRNVQTELQFQKEFCNYCHISRNYHLKLTLYDYINA